MNIALAHDSFTQEGGAERVIEALHELYPQAPVYTLVYDPKFKNKYGNWDIRTSQLQTLFLSAGSLRLLLPLIPWGVDSLNLELFDLIISSSSGFIKNLRKPKKATHINYCHTPTRFLWSEPDYVKQEVKWFARPAIKLILNRMRTWDYAGAQRVSRFIANSMEVQIRIQSYYKRESTVIHPFVDSDFWQPTKEKGDYFLVAGRLQAHKKNDLIIEIFNELGLPLHVVGTGRQESWLKSIAKPNITFLGYISDEELRDEYSGAKALVFPQLEDFGLMPLEAAACGTPTLAYGHGGVRETIVPGHTGEFFESYDNEKIKQQILAWDGNKYHAEVLRAHAKKFSKDNFKAAIKNYIDSLNENRS